MIRQQVDQQEHGYLNGHQLLSASIKLSREDQDTIDRLSDMSGPLGPNERFGPYLSAYPLPSRSHYVLARTWQDIAAPRAGCVLTRSLIIPATEWENIGDVSRFLALLVPITRGSTAEAVIVPETREFLPEVNDKRVIELVEAMFLENRQPIVMFEAAEADVMAIRLLTALWPGIRRNFATCTFALAPRKVDGREFDLVFAPKAARSRFADFSGRRIDIGSHASPRHRWSQETARQIFESGEPGFATLDVLGILRSDDRGDESSLRLVLLWNELSAKTNVDPTAVLGLLDILNSRRIGPVRMFESIMPVAARAAKIASATMSGSEGWQFFGALASKLPHTPPFQNLFEEIRLSTMALALRDPEAALNFLSSEIPAAQNLPELLLAGAGDGLASALGAGISFERIARFPPEMGLRLLGVSREFARRLIDFAEMQPLLVLPIVLGFFEAKDRELQARARDQLVPMLDNAVLAPLLPPLLENALKDELAKAAITIGENTLFELEEFYEPLGNAAKDQSSLDALRDAVVMHFTGLGADRFLVSTLRIDPKDIAWLESVDPARSRPLLVALLESTSDRAMVIVQRDKNICERILNILKGDPALAAAQMVRILAVQGLEINSLLDLAGSLISYLDQGEREQFIRQLIERAFSEARCGDERVSSFLAQLAESTDPSWLVRVATPTSASPERIGENLVRLNSARRTIRDAINAHVDELSERLIHQGSARLSGSAYRAWADMIADAGHVDTNAQLRAAISTLSFALKLTNSPVSALVVASFPVVHDQLMRSTGDEDFRSVPALLLLPFSFFVDWDRAKSARRELVESYLSSSWPPADLLVAAVNAGVERPILVRLTGSSRGRRYVDLIAKDVQRLDASLRNKVEHALAEFYSNPTSTWD